MQFREITAIIRNDRLGYLDETLKRKGVKGISVSRVTNWLSEQAEIKIYAAAGTENLVLSTIAECADARDTGVHVIVVEPVYLHA